MLCHVMNATLSLCSQSKCRENFLFKLKKKVSKSVNYSKRPQKFEAEILNETNDHITRQ